MAPPARTLPPFLELADLAMAGHVTRGHQDKAPLLESAWQGTPITLHIKLVGYLPSVHKQKLDFLNERSKESIEKVDRLAFQQVARDKNQNIDGFLVLPCLFVTIQHLPNREVIETEHTQRNNNPYLELNGPAGVSASGAERLPAIPMNDERQISGVSR